MSLYADYIKETHNRQTIESNEYFVTYRIEDKFCYLVDMYIVPERRNSGLMMELFKMVENIAKDENCSRILTSVDNRNSKLDGSLKAIKKCGFSVFKVTNNGVFFIKDL